MLNSDKEIRIGYVPNGDTSLSHPADRRRFCSAAEKLCLNYEIAKFEELYDVLIITIGADLTRWVRYKEYHNIENTKIIFDFTDMLITDNTIKDFLRGIYYYIVRKNYYLSLSYKKSIISMISASNVITCCSIEQRQMLSRYHKNVEVILDNFNDDIKITKSNYNIHKRGELHILWEGFSHGNIKIFHKLKEILSKIDYKSVHLHIITDPMYCRIGGAYFCTPTYKIISSIFNNTAISTHLYDWNSSTFSNLAVICDFALIPIPNDPVMQMKPENKLILLWTLGLPVLITPTPSYKRVLTEAKLNHYLCNDNDDWGLAIKRISDNKTERIEYLKRVKDYLIKNNCNENEKGWQKAIL